MTHLRKLLSNAWHARSGSVLILVAVSFGTLMTAAAFGMEMAHFSRQKARFVTALDEATLAAAASNVANPQPYVTQYMQANLGLGGGAGGASANHSLMLSTVSINPSADRSTWTATAVGLVQPQFMGFLYHGIVIQHTSQVSWQKNVTSEITAIVDVAGSACTNVQRTYDGSGNITAINYTSDTSCSKLAMMQEALHNLVNIGVGYTGGDSTGQVVEPSYKVGVVPFTYKIRFSNPAAALPGFLTANESASYYTTNDPTGPPLPPILPLTSVASAAQKTDLLNKIDALFTTNRSEWQRPFMVRPVLGAEAAGLLLDPDYYALFNGAVPKAFGAANNQKYVIMLTDASSVGCCFTNVNGNYSKNYVYSYTADDAKLPALCDTLKGLGVNIYTIVLDVKPGDSAGSDAVVNNYRNCASNPDYAFTVAPGDVATLKQAYTIVGKSLMKLKLSQ